MGKCVSHICQHIYRKSKHIHFIFYNTFAGANFALVDFIEVQRGRNDSSLHAYNARCSPRCNTYTSNGIANNVGR